MKRNLILLVICALIGAYYYFDTEYEKKQNEIEEKEKQLLSLEKKDIVEVTITTPEQTMKAVKNEDAWKITEPFATSADQTLWENVVTQFTTGERQRVVREEAEDLSPYGLDEPAFKVTLAKENGEEAATIHLGKETPTAGKYYALHEGSNDILTVLASIHTAIDKPLFDFRDKTVFSFANEDVKKIEVKHAGLDAVFERKDKDQWVATRPVHVRVDETQITDLMNAVRNSRIKLFIEEEPETYEGYGLVEAATRIVLWTSEEGSDSSLSARALLIGAPSATEDNYAMREGQKNVFSVSPQDFNKVPASIDALRLTKATPVRSWEVERFQVQSAGETILSASKNDGDWFLLSPNEGKGNYSDVSALVRDLTGLEIGRFVDGSKEEFIADTRFSVTFETTDTSNTIDLSGPKEWNGASYYFGALEEPLEIFAIPEDKIAALITQTTSVRMDEPEPEIIPEETTNQ